MKTNIIRHKQVSVKRITQLLKMSKSTKQPIAIKGTGMFLKYTSDDKAEWHFNVYDRNPFIICSPVSIRLKMSKTGLNEIDGFNRWQKMAKTNGVNLTLKETPIKTTRWDEILTSFNTYLSPTYKLSGVALLTDV